ncbi:MAG: hypothetical protein NTY64_06595 [Deltaproteobacteria bacterium]|nr:hypothetical protein [Deltaproteobacteria bacterium]
MRAGHLEFFTWPSTWMTFYEIINYVFRNLALREGQEFRVAMRREAFWVIPASPALFHP